MHKIWFVQVGQHNISNNVVFHCFYVSIKLLRYSVFHESRQLRTDFKVVFDILNNLRHSFVNLLYTCMALDS